MMTMTAKFLMIALVAFALSACAGKYRPVSDDKGGHDIPEREIT